MSLNQRQVDDINCSLTVNGTKSQTKTMQGVGSQVCFPDARNGYAGRNRNRYNMDCIDGSGGMSIREVPPDDMVNVFIFKNGHKNNKRRMEVKLEWTVQQLKRAIVQIVDIATSQMTLRILANRQEMKSDSSTLASYGVKDGTTIEALVGGLRGG